MAPPDVAIWNIMNMIPTAFPGSSPKTMWSIYLIDRKTAPQNSDHRQLSHIVLNHQGDKKLFETAKAALHESAFQTFRTLYGPGDPKEYDRFFTFGLSGCIGLAQQWLSSGCRESASEMGNKCNAYLEYGRSILSTPAFCKSKLPNG